MGPVITFTRDNSIIYFATMVIQPILVQACCCRSHTNAVRGHRTDPNHSRVEYYLKGKIEHQVSYIHVYQVNTYCFVLGPVRVVNLSSTTIKDMEYFRKICKYDAIIGYRLQSSGAPHGGRAINSKAVTERQLGARLENENAGWDRTYSWCR